MITSQLHKILIFLLIVPGGPIVASDWQEWLATSDFDSYVAQTMKDFKVPGAAVAIEHDGKVLVSKSYGFRDVENKGRLLQRRFSQSRRSPIHSRLRRLA
jgi:CubicO group peptidase (beta-lactamase class C family)